MTALKRICLVLITVSLMAMAIISVKGWYWDPDISQSHINTHIINREDGTAQITMVIEVDHHVLEDIGTNRYLVLAISENREEGWADKLDISENGNTTLNY